MKYIYQIHLALVLDTINEINVVSKSHELSDLLTPVSVKWFLAYLINKRVVEDGTLLKAFPVIVDCIDHRFPCSLELAISEILKAVKAILRRLPASGIDREKRVGLLCLGRSLRLLTTLRSPSKFFNFDFNVKELLQQSKQYSQNVQAYAITFVLEYLNHKGGRAVHTTSHTIEELLEILNAKEKKFGEDALTRASSSEYRYIAFEERGCVSELLENSLLQQVIPFNKPIYEGHKKYLIGGSHPIRNSVQVLSYLDLQITKSFLILSSKYINPNIVLKSRSIIEDRGQIWCIFYAVGKYITSNEKIVSNSVVQWFRKCVNKWFPKRSFVSHREIQQIEKDFTALVESQTIRIMTHIYNTMPNFIYSELSKLKRDNDQSPRRLLANSLTMQLFPACLAYFKVSAVRKATDILLLEPHFMNKTPSSKKGYSQSDWELALDICRLISRVIKLAFSNRPDSDAMSELRNVFESILDKKPCTFKQINKLICHNIFVLFLAKFNSRATKEIGNIYLQVVKMLRMLQYPRWTKNTITNEWIRLVKSEPHERSRRELSNSLIWNWKAISELLEEGLIDRHRLDNLLSLNIKAGNICAVTLLIDLLDRFILPSISPEKVEVPTDGNQCANVSTYLPGNFFRLTHKPHFAILNEFDLQKSTKALMNLQKLNNRNCREFDFQFNSTCARIRAFLNRDLLEETMGEVLSKKYWRGEEEKVEPVEIKLFTKRAIFQWFSGYAERKQNDPSKFDELLVEWMDSCNWSKTISDLPKMVAFLRICVSLAFDNTLNFNAISQSEEFIDLIITCSKKFSNLIPVRRRLLGHVIGRLGKTIIQHYEDISCEFNPRPYTNFLLQLFRRLLMHFPAVDERDQSEKHGDIHRFILIAFGHLLHQLGPCRMPKFAADFMKILQHGFLMKCYCTKTSDHTTPVEQFEATRKLFRKIYAQLLKSLTFHVLLGNKHNLEEKLIYLWIKILHKYSDFICEFYHYFSKVISVSQSVLRNILAFARPSTDEIPEYTLNAKNRFPPIAKQSIDSDIRSETPANLNQPGDYLSRYFNVSMFGQSSNDKEREAAAIQINTILYFEAVFRQSRLFSEANHNGKYVHEFLADLVTYLGLHALQKAQLKDYLTGGTMTKVQLPEIVFLESFMLQLSEDGQSILVSYLVGQLRYECLWTRFFSQCLLTLLRKSGDLTLKSIIISVLIEYLRYGTFQSYGLLFVSYNIREKLDFSELLKLYGDEERALFDNARELYNAKCRKK
ncbi:unnamed protein product [Rodentolepis nana]|uniref:Not1 domain-containing protein n=1 Tax=Rodentolepis nana TaxID=102285 RepID=A0A0R3T5S8_RODNA|nr:unnamed protein product [Rodentolepis nana]